MATYLSRTPSSAGNRKKYTWSGWIKNCATGSAQQNFMAVSTANNNFNLLYLNTAGNLVVYFSENGSTTGFLQTTALFRDPNAWYHIVFRFDSTHGTADNRIRLYVNGIQETTFAYRTNPSLNYEGLINTSGNRMDISGSGAGMTAGANSFFGIMSHVHFLDGEDRDASYFGETDSTTGEWKIKTSPTGINYGTNGFFILKDGNSVTDQSGNSNNFTVAGGTLTKTEDNPSNVFATLNPLYNPGGSSYTFSNGNTKFEESGNQWKTTFSTLSAASGKYYAEFKCNGNWMMVGVADMTRTFYGIADRNFASTTYISEQGYGYYNADGTLRYRGSETSYGATYGSGDIVQVALDCDNNRVFFGKNGTWQNSADPTNASTGFSMTATNARYAFAVAVQQDQVHANFGNGYFSTTAVASAGTNASGNGIFEYDVPTGYTALSTKGLNL